MEFEYYVSKFMEKSTFVQKLNLVCSLSSEVKVPHQHFNVNKNVAKQSALQYLCKHNLVINSKLVTVLGSSLENCQTVKTDDQFYVVWRM